MISRLFGAFFSPLRDPIYKDWIFYVFVFFTISSISSNSDGSLFDYIFSIPLIVGINWCLFIFGLSWIRSDGLNRFTIGISPKYKSAKLLNFSVLDQNNRKVEYTEIQELIDKFRLKPGEKMNLLPSSNSMNLTNHPDFKSWTESFFLWDVIFKPGEFIPMIFGPIWFSCSEVNRKIPANLCLTTTGEIGITWRKNTNSLLDYWLTHITEINEFTMIDKFSLRLRVKTVNRVIGKNSGLRKAEVATLELRVGKDGHANRRSITAFYSFIENLS